MRMFIFQIFMTTQRVPLRFMSNPLMDIIDWKAPVHTNLKSLVFIFLRGHFSIFFFLIFHIIYRTTLKAAKWGSMNTNRRWSICPPPASSSTSLSPSPSARKASGSPASFACKSRVRDFLSNPTLGQ